MSGFKIAGVVLGGFPILLKSLELYREGFESLEEWWNFRTHFIVFVDDIRHQMMRYNENLIRLLDPVIADTEDLAELLRDLSLIDPRWHGGSLEELLKQRLASEYGRFFRILGRIQEVVSDLEKLLQIDNGKISWSGSSQQKPWQWHFKRIRISFSKGKHRKVRRLAAYNDELQEILGYSERIIPIADKRKSSEPVRLFEKIRQHACGVYGAFKRQWKCNRRCPPEAHEAHVSLGAVAASVGLDVVFISGGGPGNARPSWQQVQIVSTDIKPVISTNISHVEQSTLLDSVQKTWIQKNKATKNRNLIRAVPLKLQSIRSSLKTSAAGKGTRSFLRLGKSVKFQTAASSAPFVSTLASPAQPSGPQPVADLCLFLAQDEPRSGIL